MRRWCAMVFGVGALALSSCSGNFGGGTSAPGALPPVSTPGAGPLGGQLPATPTPRPSMTPPPGDTASYALADAQHGWQCPQQAGFTCMIALNQPSPSPTPSVAPDGKTGASPSPSPSPSLTPSPVPSASASATTLPGGSSPAPVPTPSPTPRGPTVTLKIEAMPKDAPTMVNQKPGALPTTALFLARMVMSDDFNLNGWATATFTLPKEQIGGRGFALQLFRETGNHHKTVDTPIANFNQSTIKGDTLTFQFAEPATTVKKHETWVIVLYGDDIPASPVPSGSPSASPSPRSTAAP